MEIDDDPAGCYGGDLRMHIVPRNTVRELDGKGTEEGEKESVGAEQPLKIACNQEGAYEALEAQRRDGMACNGIGCISVPRAADGS